MNLDHRSVRWTEHGRCWSTAGTTSASAWIAALLLAGCSAAPMLAWLAAPAGAAERKERSSSSVSAGSGLTAPPHCSVRPQGLPAVNRPPATSARHGPAAYARQVMAVRTQASGMRGRFVVVLEPPFIVVGNSGSADVQRFARGLIRWSVGELKKRYFARDPKDIITIWLFKDARSFLEGSVRLTGEAPGTPFGYYSPANHALIMNIRTGGGTLVHEIVHPFMEANVEDCPPWLNEGMGSLYEGVGRRSGRIWGYINWRLPDLQRTIKRRKLPPFADLLTADERTFYGADPGTNYAQARYLLYYLQDRGLLQTFFKQVLATRRSDPTGRKTLMQVLGISDLVAFQRSWERWVLKLEYRNPPVR